MNKIHRIESYVNHLEINSTHDFDFEYFADHKMNL